MSKLRLENVSYVYSPGTPFEVRALENITLDIRENAITGIIGHTGSGKSTLVQLLNGLNRPTEGKILLDGEDIWQNPKEIRQVRFRVGLVMQYPEYQLFEETVRADIAFGPKNMKLSPQEIDDRVREAAELVGLDGEMLDHSPFDLSGGQKRRAAIAGVIAMRPEVLVLDEPAAGLDPRGRDAILGEIVRYREKTGATVVIVSHSMEDMARYCDNVVVLSHAGVVMQDETARVFSHPEVLTSVGLDVPEVSRVCHLLRERGVPVPPDVFTIGQAVSCLLELFGKDGQTPGDAR